MHAVDKATEGRSAKANMSVLISTAALAGRLATAYAEQHRRAPVRSRPGADDHAATRAVIFDLDGTLVDTPRAIVETFTAAFAAMGVPARDGDAIRATIGLPLERAFATLLGVAVDDGQVVLGVKQYQLLFKELILPRAASLIFPGVAAGLAALRDQGFLLAVATSKFYASADALLKAAGLRDHFHLVVGADQVAKPKPDAEMGHLIMDKLGVSAERAVMVGDTTHDLLMARGAGMRSVAVTYGVHSVQELTSSDPTWMVDTFEDVLRCVQQGLQ
jgi:phosphoglycolate phosphatase